MQTTTTTTFRPKAPARRVAQPTRVERAASQLAVHAGVGYELALVLLLAAAGQHPELYGRFAFGPLD
jgi:hypothetical protein